jgi:hypothetical protein
LHYLSSNVAAHDMGQRAAIVPQQSQVQVVQGAGPDPQHYFARLNFRFRTVPVGQRLRAAGLLEKYGFHGDYLLVKSIWQESFSRIGS